jgi:hypothetical protein
LSPLGTAATNGLLYQPRVIIMMDILRNDWEEKPKYSKKTSPRGHNSQILPGSDPEPTRCEARF